MTVENLPPRLAVLLVEAGHAALHLRDLDAAGASDPHVIYLVLEDGRSVVRS